jgi:hypothetical protein
VKLAMGAFTITAAFMFAASSFNQPPTVYQCTTVYLLAVVGLIIGDRL